MAAVEICNEALSEIGADVIQSLDEGSLSAKECNRIYATCVTDLLALDDWGAAIRRVALAQIPNDRPAEWAFAYARPTDIASILRLLPNLSGAYPQWGWYDGGPLWQTLGTVSFIEDAGVIYSNIEAAVAEYVVSTMSEAYMRPLFRRALAMMIAARVAYPIRKDRQLRADMLTLADAAVRLAMADDQNRYPRLQPRYISQVDIARGGGMIGLN